MSKFPNHNNDGKTFHPKHIFITILEKQTYT